MMRHHLHMPSYFLGTFTEYPLVCVCIVNVKAGTGNIADSCFSLLNILNLILFYKTLLINFRIIRDKCKAIRNLTGIQLNLIFITRLSSP